MSHNTSRSDEIQDKTKAATERQRAIIPRILAALAPPRLAVWFRPNTESRQAARRPRVRAPERTSIGRGRITPDGTRQSDRCGIHAAPGDQNRQTANRSAWWASDGLLQWVAAGPGHRKALWGILGALGLEDVGPGQCHLGFCYAALCAAVWPSAGCLPVWRDETIVAET